MITITTKRLAIVFSLLLMTLLPITGSAAVYTPEQPADTFPSWLIRARAIAVIPDPGSSTITVIGGNVTDISTTVVPELDFSYFFSPHIAAELILATNRHSVTASGTSLGTVSLGRVTLLPPTLVLQYHFGPKHQFDPYIGAGLNYTFFYDETPRTVTSICYEDTASLALQAGIDFNIDCNWVINVDVKKLFLRPSVTTTGPALSTKAHIEPYIVGAGVGYRF